MTEHTWVLTTTLPDGTFDIFRFAAWLEQATLLELQLELLYVETCMDEYGTLETGIDPEICKAFGLENAEKLYRRNV